MNKTSPYKGAWLGSASVKADATTLVNSVHPADLTHGKFFAKRQPGSGPGSKAACCMVMHLTRRTYVGHEALMQKLYGWTPGFTNQVIVAFDKSADHAAFMQQVVGAIPPGLDLRWVEAKLTRYPTPAQLFAVLNVAPFVGAAGHQATPVPRTLWQRTAAALATLFGTATPLAAR